MGMDVNKPLKFRKKLTAAELRLVRFSTLPGSTIFVQRIGKLERKINSKLTRLPQLPCGRSCGLQQKFELTFFNVCVIFSVLF